MFPVILRLRRFARDDRGGVLAEFVMVLPALMWAYLALFVYWDAFRNTNTVQKAAYTISDTISREMITFPATYVDGLRNVMDYMIDADQDVKMRVTSITYDIDALQFKVLWSYSPSGAMPELTTETLQLLKERIPKMSDIRGAFCFFAHHPCGASFLMSGEFRPISSIRPIMKGTP